MRRGRFTVRRLMLAVAVVALLLGAGFEAVRFRAHWRKCRALVTFHDRRMRESLRQAAAWPDPTRIHAPTDGKTRNEAAKEALTRAAHHAEMRATFKRAAFRFWEPIPADRRWSYVNGELVWNRRR